MNKCLRFSEYFDMILSLPSHIFTISPFPRFLDRRLTLYAMLPMLLLAQAPDTLWTKTYGGTLHDVGYSVQQTSDGGYIIAGSTMSFGAGTDDVYLIKTDSLGDTLWTRTYGGVRGEVGYAIQQTSDTCYIIAGCTNSNTNDTIRFYLLKIDRFGDTLWTRKYTGGRAYAARQTDDDGFALVGITPEDTGTYKDVHVIKTDVNGDTLWTRTYGTPGNHEYGYDICQTMDGGYAVGGFRAFSGISETDFWLLRIDEYGDTLWTRTYGGVEDDWVYGLEQTSDTGFIMVGKTGTVWPIWDVFLVKTDAIGDTLWTRILGGPVLDYGEDVEQTSDNNYIIAGLTSGQGPGSDYDCYIIKVDSLGDTLWTTSVGGDGWDCAHSIQQTSDGGYIIAGYYDSFGPDDSDVYLIRLAPETGTKEEISITKVSHGMGTTILTGSLLLPKDEKYKVFDIQGRVVDTNHLATGIYFIQIDGKITRKVVKIR